MFESIVYATLEHSDLRVSNPLDADVFYLPRRLLGPNKQGLNDPLIPFLHTQGPWVERYSGVDHLFIHMVFAMNRMFPIADSDVHIHPYSLTIPDIPWERSVESPRTSIKNTIVPYHSNADRLIGDTDRMISIFFLGCLNPMFGPGPMIQRGRAVRGAMFPALANVTDSVSIQTRRWAKGQTHRDFDFISMQKRSVFCAVPYGDSPSSKRLFDSFRTGCIPLVLADDIRFPHEENFLNFENLVVQIPMYSVDKIEWAMMRVNDRWQKVYRQAMDGVFGIFNLSVEAEETAGEQFWAWTWAEYVKQCYVAAVKRRVPERNPLLGPKRKPKRRRKR
jgi:hypothetical protein